MFRVLIADDEDSVVQSLIYSMPCEELELQIAGTAADGATALETAKRENIDIAILDIRMPGINGLELCERLKQMNEQIQLIIVSGYAEFAYAEKAIQYGVLGYCLKPLDYTQMTRFLRKAVQNLRKNRHMTGFGDLMEILERRNEGEIQEYFGQLGFEQEKYFIAVSAGNRKVEELESRGISLRFGHGQWGYIMKTNPADFLEEEGCRLCGCSGIGYMCQDVSGKEIYEAFEECIARAFQHFICGEDKICGCLDEGKAKCWLTKIRDKMRTNDWDGADKVLDEIGQNAWQNFTVRSALQLCNLIFFSSLSQEEGEDYYIYNVEQLVNTYGNFQEMLQQLRDLLRESHAGEEDNKAFTNAAFMKLMKYIDDNYRNEISLTSAAQMLHMNANYVSQLFKRESGITFVRYITQKRLEDAKKLLVTTQKPLTDIALDVGFNDTFHFVKTFKKFIGMTPGQYRANN